MKKFVSARQRTPSSRHLIFSAFALSMLALCSLFAVAGGAQQDDRGIGVKTEAAKPPSPEEAKARAARPEIVLQTGYTIGGLTGMTFSPDGRLLATRVFNSSQVKLWDTRTGHELRTVVGSTGVGYLGMLGGVSSLAFSPDGRVLALGGTDNSIKLVDVMSGRELRTINAASGVGGGMGGVLGMAFSRDGRRLASFGMGVTLWDVATGQQAGSIEMGLGSGVGLGGGGFALTPDGAQLAFVASDLKKPGKLSVKFVEFATARETRSMALPDDFSQTAGHHLAFTPDGRLVAAAQTFADVGTQLKFWDLSARSKGRVLVPKVPPNKLVIPSFSPDGRVLSLAEGITMRFWDTATGGELPSLQVPVRAPEYMPEPLILSTAYSPDGRLLATGGNDMRFDLWETASARRTLRLEGHTNHAFDARFSPDGTRLYAGGKTVWDVSSGRGVRASAPDRDAIVESLSPDGRTLARRTMRDNRIELYEAATRRRLHTLAPAEKGAPTVATFSPDGRILASSYMPTDWTQGQPPKDEDEGGDDEETQKALKEAAKKMQKDPSAAMKAIQDAMAQGNSRSLGAGPGGRVRLWDTASGLEVRTINTPGGGNPYMPAIVRQVAFSADGRTLAVVSQGSAAVTLWDVGTGRQTGVLGGAPADASGGMFGMPSMGALGGGTSIYSVAFSPDGRLVAAGGKRVEGGLDVSAMMSAAMANAQKGKMKPPSAADQQAMMKEMLGSVKVSGPLKLWETASGRELLALTGHAGEVRAVAFSPDGRLLASAGAEGTLKLWDTGTGRELRTLPGQDSPATSLAFNPTGTLLAATAEDGSTSLWDARTGERLATLVSLYDGGEWLVVTPDGLFDGSPAAWDQILWRFSQNTFDVAPVETFFNEFFHPGLLADLVAGKRPKAPRDISQLDRQQPEVTLDTGAAANAPVSTRTLSVRVNIAKAPAGAKDVRLFRNGSLVKVWRGDVLKGQASATLEATIPVVAGENRLSAYAFNRDNVKSADARAVFAGADALRRAGTAYVLAVGVNAYANPQYNLKYAVADAQAFGEEVRRQQAQLARYERVEVVPLLDKEATKANILAALKRLAGDKEALPAGAPAALGALKQAQPEDVVVVYFAGHGTAQGNRFYLIPHDLGYAGDRNSLDEAGLRTMLAHSISDEELESTIEALDAAQLLLVIDACNSGQALEAEEKRRGPMNSKGLAQLAYEKGMYILTAAQSYQAALEAAQLGHGLLTYALVEEGLKKGEADGEPKDGTLLAKEWLDFAAERVPQMQLEKMRQARGLGLNLNFVPDAPAANDAQGIQRPRAFYRRELESNPLVVAKKQ